MQEMRDQLSLVQSPGDVTDIKPTSAQSMLPLILLSQVIETNVYMFVSTAATMATQSHIHVKEEPLEEVLPSAAVYSTCMCIGRVYSH